jgi:O-antigen ligase
MNIVAQFTDLNFLLLLVCLAGFYWLAWRSRFKALMILTVLLPSYIIRTTLFTIPVTFLELMIVGLFIIWIVTERQYPWLLMKKKLPHDNPIPYIYRVIITLILLAATVSIFVSGDLKESLGIWKAYFLEPIMLFLVVMQTVRTREQIYDLIDVLGFTAILLFPLAIYQHFTGHTIPLEFWSDPATRRITTIFGYPNANSLLLAPIVALYGGYIFKRESVAKTIYKLVVIVCGLAIIFWARTDGALLALAVVAVYLLGTKIPYKKTFWLVVVLLSIASGYWYSQTASWQQQWQRIHEGRLGLQSSSFEIRLNQWTETTKLLSHKPLFGSGLVGYQTDLIPYHWNPFLEIFLYPHNIFLNFWIETGLVGLLAFIWLGWLLFQNLRKKTTDPILSVMLLVCWLTIIIHGLVDVPYFKNDLSAFWWLLVAATVLATNFRESTPSKHN